MFGGSHDGRQVRPLTWRRTLLLCLGTILAANLLFALFSLTMAALDPSPVSREVRQGFASGALLPVDWLDLDSRRGANSYNECVILQMMINDPGSVAEKAFAPRFYVLNENYEGACETLRRIASGQADYTTLYRDIYARYWHGDVALGSALIRTVGLPGLRTLLKISIYGALILLFIAAIRARGDLAALGAGIAIAGGTVWGLHYYGQSISYAPGDATVILGLAAMIAMRERLADPARLAVAGALYGSVVVYFEFLTGQLPTGAGLLFATGFALGYRRDRSARHGWICAIGSLGGMVAGAVATVAIKQAIAFAMLGMAGLSKFEENLAHYTGAESRDGLALYLDAFHSLPGEFYTYTEHVPGGTQVVILAFAASWLAALLIAARQRSWAIPIGWFFAALAIPAWIILMPQETVEHPSYFTRILIVPIALGLALCLRPLLARRAR